MRLVALLLLLAPTLTEAQPHECPYGHTDLKMVELVWGMPLIQRDAAGLDAEAEVERIERRLMGCIVPSNVGEVPGVIHVCRVCGFEQVGLASDLAWARVSNDPATFDIPLATRTLAEGRRISASADEVTYTQVVRGNEVVREVVSVRTARPKSEVDQLVPRGRWESRVVGAEALRDEFPELAASVPPDPDAPEGWRTHYNVWAWEDSEVVRIWFTIEQMDESPYTAVLYGGF